MEYTVLPKPFQITIFLLNNIDFLVNNTVATVLQNDEI